MLTSSTSDNDSVEKLNVSFRFPSDPMMKRLWVRNIGREDWYPTDRSRICSDHFKERDLYHGSTYVSLRVCAVPVRFKRKPVVTIPVEEVRYACLVRLFIIMPTSRAGRNRVPMDDSIPNRVLERRVHLSIRSL